jgi:glycogen debranching enzyme
MEATRRRKTSLRIPTTSYDPESTAPTTPKTPADEGLEFFESPFSHGQAPIRVYELRLDPDGGPNKDRSASSLMLLRCLIMVIDVMF